VLSAAGVRGLGAEVRGRGREALVPPLLVAGVVGLWVDLLDQVADRVGDDRLVALPEVALLGELAGKRGGDVTGDRRLLADDQALAHWMGEGSTNLRLDDPPRSHAGDAARADPCRRAPGRPPRHARAREPDHAPLPDAHPRDPARSPRGDGGSSEIRPDWAGRPLPWASAGGRGTAGSRRTGRSCSAR